MARSLIEDLQERIESTGPLPFKDFMQAALYDPRHGYYTTRVPGHGGDYRTSPSTTLWFGRLVARELQRMWEALGTPNPFWVVEVGGGLGDLAAGAMEAAGPLSPALRWRFVERFERVRQWQRRRLGSMARSVEWSTDLGESPGATGCVLANEVLDNFPVHVLEVASDHDVREVYVHVEGGRFVAQTGPLSEAALKESAQAVADLVPEGVRFEVCPGLEEWCRQASQALERGYLLLIDYGDLEPDLWLAHPEGTLATHGPSHLGPSPFEDPGRKDITASVNFSAVARAAGAAGFCTEPLITQRAWLLSLGLAEVAGELEVAGFSAALEGWIEEAVVLESQLHLLLELGADGGLGDLVVLRATKGAPSPWAPTPADATARQTDVDEHKLVG